jgi:hypothetical protein
MAVVPNLQYRSSKFKYDIALLISYLKAKKTESYLVQSNCMLCNHVARDAALSKTQEQLCASFTFLKITYHTF